jgi:hypothetical protein
MNQRTNSDFVAFGPVQNTFVVKNLSDSGAGSLRECLAWAGPGEAVQFECGLTGTLTLTGGALTIPDGVSIQGPGPALVTVNGNGAGRLFMSEKVTADTLRIIDQ